jgi:Carboxypeptidase regulatory-like domain
MNASRRLALVMLVAMAATVLATASPTGSFAQDERPRPKESQLRTVRGTVVDKDEAPVETAVVYLKNVRTQDITTHLSEKDGQFRFSGLDLNVDYEIHAEHEGWISSSRSVSNFDNRKEYVVTLRLDHKKSAK